MKGVVNIEDLRKLAKKRLPKIAYDFIEGGPDDEVGLVSNERVWVEASPKETDLTHVKLGDPVNVTVDTYPGRVWTGRVESISPASGAEFSVLPPQNVFVRFFVPEPEVANLKLGTRVHISCDGCAPDLTGAIGFIAAQSEFTPPVIYSVGNRERLVFKVEARFQSGLPQRPGLPVEVNLAGDPTIVPVPR